MSAWLEAALHFEKDHAATIRDFDFQRGDLVLVQNTAIEKSLNRKMRPQYLGPLIVISHNRGGAYIICELNGSMFDRPIAAFHVIPYFARQSLPLPDLESFLDVLASHLHELKDSIAADPEAGEAADFDVSSINVASLLDVPSGSDNEE